MCYQNTGIHAIPGTLNSGKFIRSDKFDYRVEHTHNESDSTDQPKKLYMNIENIRKYKHFATPTSRRLVFLTFNFKFTALVSFEDSNFPAFVKNFPYITDNIFSLSEHVKDKVHNYLAVAETAPLFLIIPKKHISLVRI